MGSLRLYKSALISLVTLGALGCNNKITGKIGLSSFAPDFKKSQIISNSPGIADGVSNVVLVVQLINSDNSIVVGFTPTLALTNSLGVNSSACTASNSNGVSTCVLRSSVAETVQVSVSNVQSIMLKTNVVFAAPTVSPTQTSTVPSVAYNSTSASGHSISATIGGQSPLVNTSGNGAKLFGGVLGNVVSH